MAISYSTIGFKTTKKIFVKYKSEKMSISLRKSLVPWLYDIFEGYPYKKQKNHGSQIIA